jgi:hypothetical protein
MRERRDKRQFRVGGWSYTVMLLNDQSSGRRRDAVLDFENLTLDTSRRRCMAVDVCGVECDNMDLEGKVPALVGTSLAKMVYTTCEVRTVSS